MSSSIVPQKRASDSPDFQLQVYLTSDKAQVPKKGSALAAGFDIFSAEDSVVPSNGKALIATGIKIKIPEGTYGRVAPRSGLAFKHMIQTGAGVIDADYSGELKVLLFNHGPADFPVSVGDRIAQLILEKIVLAEAVQIESYDETDSVRGAGGFGSTGK